MKVSVLDMVHELIRAYVMLALTGVMLMAELNTLIAAD